MSSGKTIWVIEYDWNDEGDWVMCEPLLVFASESEAEKRAELRRKSYAGTNYRAWPYVPKEQK